MTPQGGTANPQNSPTVKSLLDWARPVLRGAGCDTPALDAELLLSHALKVDRARLVIESARRPETALAEHFRRLVHRRAGREPLPYILGEWEFCGLALEITPAVLIPRPETETLVEACLHLFRRPGPAQRSTRNSQPGDCRAGVPSPAGNAAFAAEAGIGSGAISIALAKGRPDLQIIATDTSPEALAVAGRNVARHGLESRVRLLEGDLLGPLEGEVERGSLDFIVANLPYIASGDFAGLEPEVRDWEPRGALDGGADGLDYIRKLIDQAPRWLKAGGFVALEISPEQAESVRGHLGAQGFDDIEMIPDLAGRARVARGVRGE